MEILNSQEIEQVAGGAPVLDVVTTGEEIYVPTFPSPYNPFGPAV